MRIKSNFIILIIGVFILSACGQNRKIKLKDNLNQEVIGSWATDNNACQIVLINESTNLVLVSFTNKNKHIINNLPLSVHKDGIFIRFWATENKALFSAIYSEGIMILEDDECKQAFHKTN